MVVPMNLEPIVLVVPFLKVADVFHLNHKLACMLIPISLHLANVSRKDMLFSDFSLSLHPDCLGGGIGRHAGLKIPWTAMSVRVRFPSEAPQSPF